MDTGGLGIPVGGGSLAPSAASAALVASLVNCGLNISSSDSILFRSIQRRLYSSTFSLCSAVARALAVAGASSTRRRSGAGSSPTPRTFATEPSYDRRHAAQCADVAQATCTQTKPCSSSGGVYPRHTSPSSTRPQTPQFASARFASRAAAAAL